MDILLAYNCFELCVNECILQDITNAESFFQALDFDGSGDIHPAEIGAGLKRLDIVAADGDIQALVDMVDTNNDGNISLLEVRFR